VSPRALGWVASPEEWEAITDPVTSRGLTIQIGDTLIGKIEVAELEHAVDVA
jgi:hypothetical protein